MSSQCWPIDLPVRGSATPGKSGFNSRKEKPLKAASFWPKVLDAAALSRRAAQRLAVHDRHVGGGVGAATDAGLDLSGRILPATCTIVSSEVPQARCRVMPGVSGDRPDDSAASRPRFQSRRMLDHRTHRHFTELLPMQAEFLDRRAQRAHRHAQVADIGIGPVLPAKRDADTAKDGDRTTVQHQAPRGWPAPPRA